MTTANSCSLRFTLSIAYTETDWDGTINHEVESIQCFDMEDVEREMRIFAECMVGVVVDSIDVVQNF